MSIVFGDSQGLTIFIGAILFFALYWRVSFVFNDNWAIANTLIAVADGHLYLADIVYGPEGYIHPGMHVVDGRWYGRNYGQVVLALPFLALIEVVAWIADLSIAIAGAWSLLLVAFAGRVGDLLGDRDRFALVGSAGALIAFAVNTAVARPIAPRDHHLLALQLSTIVAAALVGVMAYRLLAAIHDRRTGVFVAAAVVLASPVGFWALMPKRHVPLALLAIVVLYSFYVSRSTASARTALWSRSVAYAAVGLAAWIHAAEALTLFIVLVPLDLATARSNAPRRLAVVGGVFLLSLVPFFVTNQLIAGHPLLSPRFLWTDPAVSSTPGGPETPTPGGPETPTPGGSGAPGDSTPGADPGGPGTPADGQSGDAGGGGVSLEPILAPFLVAIEQARQFFTNTASLASTAFSTWAEYTSRGVEETSVDPVDLYYGYIHSDPTATRAKSFDLALLEVTPVYGVFVAIPVMLGRRFYHGLTAERANLRDRLGPLRSPVRQTDLLALSFVVMLVLFNLYRVPSYASWTVRFVLPMVPYGLYFVGRLAPVRRVVAEAADWLAYTYAGLVLIGGQLLVVYLVDLDPAFGEVIQFHGLLGLAAAAVVAGWALLASMDVLDDARFGAVAIAAALATGTLYLLLTGLEYFVTGHFALGMSEIVSEAIPLF